MLSTFLLPLLLLSSCTAPTSAALRRTRPLRLQHPFVAGGKTPTCIPQFTKPVNIISAEEVPPHYWKPTSTTLGYSGIQLVSSSEGGVVESRKGS